jgi:hypothetical protein
VEGPELRSEVVVWEAWTPTEVMARLAGVGVPWCVVGGWAIDLFIGRETRPHGDLEIAVARADFPAVRPAFAGLHCHLAKNGRVMPLPAGREPPEGVHQVWVLDPAAQAWRLDVMLEPGDAATWCFRRKGSPRFESRGSCGVCGVECVVPVGVPVVAVEGQGG